MPLLKEVGCYVNADNDHAFMFEASDKLMCISGYEAFTQALVINELPAAVASQ